MAGVTTGAGDTTVTVTPSPGQDPTSGWQEWFSDEYGFEFKLPEGSIQSDLLGRFQLPIRTPGTNLVEKYLDLSVVGGAATCKSPDIGGEPATTGNVTIIGIQFFKESGVGAAAGNTYDFVAYSTQSNNNCVSFTFILHSANIGNYQTPPPEFNKAAESAVFDLIIKTFDWTD